MESNLTVQHDTSDEGAALGAEQVQTLQRQLEATQTLYQSLLQDSQALNYLLQTSSQGEAELSAKCWRSRNEMQQIK